MSYNNDLNFSISIMHGCVLVLNVISKGYSNWTYLWVGAGFILMIGIFLFIEIKFLVVRNYWRRKSHIPIRFVRGRGCTELNDLIGWLLKRLPFTYRTNSIHLFHHHCKYTEFADVINIFGISWASEAIIIALFWTVKSKLTEEF